MEISPQELYEFVEEAIEHVVSHFIRHGWRPSDSQTVRCLWCAERMLEGEWIEHRRKCPKNPKVKRNEDRLTRLKRMETADSKDSYSKKPCKGCGDVTLLNDRGVCFICAEPRSAGPY